MAHFRPAAQNKSPYAWSPKQNKPNEMDEAKDGGNVLFKLYKIKKDSSKKDESSWSHSNNSNYVKSSHF